MVKPLENTGFEFPTPEFQLLPSSREEFPEPDPGNSQTACGKAKWTGFMSSSELAEVLKTDRRNITNWYPVVREAYCWMTEVELKTGMGKATRYTSFCCEQFELLMVVTAQGKGYDDWIASVYAAHPDEYANWLQSQSQQSQDVIDGAFVGESGTLETFTEVHRAMPLIQFNFQTLNVNLQSADTAPLNQQTQRARTVTAHAAEVLQQAISAKFKADLAQVVAQNENLAAGIQASAVVSAMQELGLGKPPAPVTDTPIAG